MQNRFLIKKCGNAEDLPLPRYMTEHAAGMDIYANVQKPVIIAAGGIHLVPTGIAISLPPGFEAQIRPRSGLALKHGVTLLNSPGTIDADYRGEIAVIVINHGRESFTVERGMRIAQMVVCRYETAAFAQVETLDETPRGDGGFGHTGT